MNRNECINCKYYEKCGKPSRPNTVAPSGLQQKDERKAAVNP